MPSRCPLVLLGHPRSTAGRVSGGRGAQPPCPGPYRRAHPDAGIQSLCPASHCRPGDCREATGHPLPRARSSPRFPGRDEEGHLSAGASSKQPRDRDACQSFTWEAIPVSTGGGEWGEGPRQPGKLDITSPWELGRRSGSEPGEGAPEVLVARSSGRPSEAWLRPQGGDEEPPPLGLGAAGVHTVREPWAGHTSGGTTGLPRSRFLAEPVKGTGQWKCGRPQGRPSWSPIIGLPGPPATGSLGGTLPTSPGKQCPRPPTTSQRHLGAGVWVLLLTSELHVTLSWGHPSRSLALCTRQAGSLQTSEQQGSLARRVELGTLL